MVPAAFQVITPTGRGPTLATLREVEQVLRATRNTLSLNEIRRRMSARAVRHATVRAAVNEFLRWGLAREDASGVKWIAARVPRLRGRGHGRGPVPDIDDLAGSLARFGPVEDWKRELDAMRGEEE
jgi:hypothetical protein